MAGIVEQLSALLGDKHVLTGDAVTERATSHWNTAPMTAKAIVFPGNTEEVSAVLSTCHAASQTVVTQGGLTNCVAAAEPSSDDIVISLSRMNCVVEVDAVDGIAIVEAGALLQIVQETVASQGLRFPLDLGARGNCTIGGNVATNAGGINVLRRAASAAAGRLEERPRAGQPGGDLLALSRGGQL